MLEIRNLHASVGGKGILQRIDLTVRAGEVHAVMGPNGSGKSTLAQVIAGREAYEVTTGEVIYDGKNLLEMSPEDRAREGVFMAFQYPVEIPGIANNAFLRASVNAIRKYRGLPELPFKEFRALLYAQHGRELVGCKSPVRKRELRRRQYAKCFHLIEVQGEGNCGRAIDRGKEACEM